MSSRRLLTFCGRAAVVVAMASLAVACDNSELKQLKQENLELKEKVSSLRRDLNEQEDLVDFLQNPPVKASLTGRRDRSSGPIVFQWIKVYDDPPIDESEVGVVGKVPHGTRITLVDRLDTGVRIYYRFRAHDKLRTDGWVNERFVYIVE